MFVWESVLLEAARPTNLSLPEHLFFLAFAPQASQKTLAQQTTTGSLGDDRPQARPLSCSTKSSWRHCFVSSARQKLLSQRVSGYKNQRYHCFSSEAIETAPILQETKVGNATSHFLMGFWDGRGRLETRNQIFTYKTPFGGATPSDRSGGRKAAGQL